MKYLFLMFGSVLMLASCMKDKGCTPVQPAAEKNQIVNYANANSIAATEHASGLHYQVIAPGAGITPHYNSTVTVNYVGKLLNGTTFDSSTAPISFRLDQVIEGWGVGIPLIKKGGRIKLIIPSAMAYGCNGRSPIPENAILYFDVELLNVQ